MTDRPLSVPVDEAALDTLFREARTYNAWQDRPLPEGTPQRIYELMKWGPTSANVSPARFVFVMTPEGKARLSPHLSKGNHDKTMAAPITVIVAYDLEFAARIPFLAPHSPGAVHWFADPVVKQETAMRNSSLQGAYMILAARALGLDCGPMSGFDQAGVNAEFFAGTSIRSNFLINMGYGSTTNLFPRNPRLPFEEACTVA